MPRIYVCFVWHMHQPFYKDLLSGEYKLPWTRLHGLKDYYGMVSILRDFPTIRQTFNLVPSLLVQVEDYARGGAVDPFLRCALKPAEELTGDEQAFMLRYFFQCNDRMILRFPRYAELYEAWRAADHNIDRARRLFHPQALRDLQVLSQLAWFDEEFLESDGDVRALAEKGRDFTLDDQAFTGRKQTEILGRVLPAYRDFAARGQIELTTTPFYHPILPLLCDSSIAEVSHPFVPLPSRFRYPEDAHHQLASARAYVREHLGVESVGLWPSEGSVSDDALAIAHQAGFQWFASDNGVLARTLNRRAGPAETYRPYLWSRDGAELRCIFRDHFLSDLVGFVYSRMDAVEAARHFLDRILHNAHPIVASGRDALVPVILDGENAWEYYDRNGRPFLCELYRRIAGEPEMEAVTVSEALARIEPERLDHVFPGSWINANFDVWIGAEEDNKAWEYLLRARQAYEQTIAAGTANAGQQLAYEELLIAEGSDWCWWYGPEHDSANKPEFDALFRSHLANVYSALGLQPPEELSRPILRLTAVEFHQTPTGPVRPSIDGEITSYFEWLGAGQYRVDSRSGAMHGHRFLIRSLHYGSDGSGIFLRLDFENPQDEKLRRAVARFRVSSPESQSPPCDVSVLLGEPSRQSAVGEQAAFSDILEVRIPISVLGHGFGGEVRFQVSLWQDGLPMDALPAHGWLEFSTLEPAEWFG